VPGALETLIEGLAKYSWRTFVGIFVASAALLLLANRFGVKDWLAANKAYVVIALLVSGATQTPEKSREALRITED